MSESFCVKAIRLQSNTRYQGLDRTPFTGNNADTFRHPITEKACGDQMNYGTLFAYLFRRFGYPNAAWDDFKDLAKYYLSTPLPDMVLCVIPYAGGDTFIHFRFLVTEQAYITLEAFEQRAFNDFRARMFNWIEANHLLPDWMDEFVEESKKSFSPANNWREAFEYLGWFTHEKDDSEYKFLGDWFKEIISRYEEIEPRPRLCVTRSLNWEEWSDEDPLKKYYQAAYETLLDLQRPVRVRDIHINAFGRIPDEKLDDYPESANYATSAGYPSGDIGNQAPAEFAKLHARIYELGNGNVEKGSEVALKLCSEQKPSEATQITP